MRPLREAYQRDELIYRKFTITQNMLDKAPLTYYENMLMSIVKADGYNLINKK